VRLPLLGRDTPSFHRSREGQGVNSGLSSVPRLLSFYPTHLKKCLIEEGAMVKVGERKLKDKVKVQTNSQTT
jgi:hypothetical protein